MNVVNQDKIEEQELTKKVCLKTVVRNDEMSAILNQTK